MSPSPTDPGSTQLGPYTLLRKLGQGGMGEVHLASDSRLDRKVAIKILPENLRDDPQRRMRFLREARAVAQLSHPNITQIFDVGESDGRDYIAFELVEGRTLAERIAEGQLSLTELVELALPLADAIAYAHERGIVHRDLKTANVMVTTRGHAKLLDFGLAKILSESSQAPEAKKNTTLTLEGAIFGTPDGMSPEQALGKPLDARSDIFSFGSLLYEMAAGRPAFQGATVMEIMHAVIHREPDSLSRMRGDLPSEFIACVAKALRKDVGERYQTMNDLAADLRHFKRRSDSGLVPPATQRGTRRIALAALTLVALCGLGWIGWRFAHSQTNLAPAAIARHSLAVLPFTNLGSSAEDASFSAGLHSDVLTRLSKISSLKVIARTSVLEYATTTKPLKQIGQELGVTAILSGELQRSGNAMKLNLTLHDAATDDSLWADTYNRELSSKDIFAVQSEIAEAVARALQAQLSPADKQGLHGVPTTNDKAYDAYLAGLALLEKYEPEYQRGVELLESSVALDPNFALAWASLAEARGGRYWGREPENTALLASAFDAARRALALQPDLPEGHLRLGQCHYFSRDYENAEREFEIAERGLPNSSDLLLARSSLYRRTGHWTQSRDALERAVEISPRDQALRWSLAITLIWLGDYDAALRQMDLDRALRGGKSGDDYYEWVAKTNRDGRVPAEAFQSPTTSNPFGPENFILRWRLRLMARDPSGAIKDLEPAPERLSHQWHDYPRALLVAIAHDLAGDSSSARTQYETARGVALSQIEAHPEDARPLASLALSLAGLDQREEALSTARRATELLPMERDSVVGGGLMLDRFYTELRVGAIDEAVRSLDTYLAHPALFSLRTLMLDPRLDALKDNAAFQELKRRLEKR